MTTNGGILQDLSINHDLITTKFSCSIQSRNTVSITRDDSSLLSYRKSYIAWDKLERANKPDNYTEKTKYLSKNAKALLSVVYQKLKKQHLLLLNHKYISTITNSGRRQNQNVVKELSELLDISYHRSTEDHKGKKYEYVYKFTLKSETKNPSKKCVIRKKISSSNTSSTYIDKNKIINNRSNKSNFCKFNSGSNNTDQLKDSEVSKNTEITKNGFLGSGKHLNEMLEYLTDDICNILRTRSGRNFTDRAIKEIAKAVSRSKQGSKAFFYHIKGFIAYLSKILRFEKRDTIKGF